MIKYKDLKKFPLQMRLNVFIENLFDRDMEGRLSRDYLLRID